MKISNRSNENENDRYEIHTILSFILPQFMWTQVKSWLNTEVRFSTEVKSHNVWVHVASHVNVLLVLQIFTAVNIY